MGCMSLFVILKWLPNVLLKGGTLEGILCLFGFFQVYFLWGYYLFDFGSSGVCE